jgi:hypothetical protein
MVMDIIRLLEVLENSGARINLLIEGKRIFEIRTKDKSIDVEISDLERFKTLVKELRK